MTPPRIVCHGHALFITIRCVKRTHQFVPKRRIREHLDYAMAAIGEKYEGRIQIHGFKFMSNHLHILLTDVAACLPAFVGELDSILARNLNAVRGVGGKVFESGYGVQILLSEEEILKKLVYMYGNAVRANLVARARHWKSSTSLQVRFGERFSAKRPQSGIWAGKQVHTTRASSRRSGRAKFALRTRFGEEARVEIVRPAIFLHLSNEELRERMLRDLDAYELELMRVRKAEGKGVLGWKKVVEVHFMAMPGPEERFGRQPKFSGGTPEVRQRALRWYKRFLSTYYDAMGRYRAGDRAAVFPEGTWKMKQLFNVPCAPVPDS